MEFLKQPIRLRAHLAPVALPDDEAVMLLSEQDEYLLNGPLYKRLVPLLDGSRVAGQIVHHLKNDYQSFQVIEAIVRLHKDGQITSAATCAEPPDRAAYWEAQRVELDETSPRSAAVHALDHEAGESMRRGLQSLGIDVAPADAAIDVVVVSDYLQEELELFNHQATRPWLLVKPLGSLAWLGPMFVPGQTACWACLSHRLRRNRQAHHLLAQQNGLATKIPQGSIPAAVQTVVGLTATQILRWFNTPNDHPLANSLLTVNTATCEIAGHHVIKRPQCPVCGSASLPEPSPLVLERRATVGQDSGHRLVSAEETLRRYEHHVSPLTGIVPRLASVTDDGVTQVYSAGHHHAKPVSNWSKLLDQRRNNAGGKGVTPAQAKAGALAEALERYSSLWDGTEPTITASLAELGELAIHPNACMQFSEAQFANREAPSEECRSYKNLVPLPLDQDQPIAWTKAWSLSDQTWRYVAAGFAYFGFKQSAHDFFCVGDSNGNAAGTCLEDAILQGFLELVERDSVALWWYNRLPRPGVDLRGVNDDYIAALKAHYASIQRRFWLLDLTADLGIPAFVALTCRSDEGPNDLVAGFGAHLDPRIGILRALTEMNQLMPHALRQTERIDRRLPAPGGRLTSRHLQVAEHPFLSPDPRQPMTELADFRLPVFDDLRDEVEYCRQTVERRDLEMLVVDLSRPDVGMPVVKVIVPGLRHFWRRLAPGRLYDVPVQMGCRAEPLREDEINPVELSA